MRRKQGSEINFRFSDPFTQLEQELRERERDAEDARQAKEAIFADKVAQREKKLRERADAVSISLSARAYSLI